ncbi:hypothetical protein GGF46_005214 [Coemansia sp. RSA 552]|nr:hypothetical protein GGF46_005214 [Coemansia sp. RSA 552]
MSPVVFVPEHVNMDDLDKCLLDKFTTFIPMGTTPIGTEAAWRTDTVYYVLEKDHFISHYYGSIPNKIHYRSRNAYMSMSHTEIHNYYLRNGYKMEAEFIATAQPPMLYFVCVQTNDCLVSCETAKGNNIVEYFDRPEDQDLVHFAGIVRSKSHCVQTHFIVNIGHEYRAVDASNVESTFVFTRGWKEKVSCTLADGTATIQTLEAERPLMVPRRPRPGFLLRDSNKKLVEDGGRFALQIVNDMYDDSEDEDSLGGLTATERLFYRKDWLIATACDADGCPQQLGAHPDFGDIFQCETINGIVYLKLGDRYLYNTFDGMEGSICVGVELPAKEQRIQIQYTEAGDMTLAMWGQNVHAGVEWMKASCGIVTFQMTEEGTGGANTSMLLRAVRM